MVAKTLFKLFTSAFLHIVVMIGGIHISQEIVAMNVLTDLKSSLEQRQKHVLRLLQLYGDQYLCNKIYSVRIPNFN